MTERVVPHWRGDLLLVLAGVAYASYTILGRDVLRRRDPLDVTTESILWGALALLPLAALEWARGLAPVWSVRAAVGVGYLALAITAAGYLVWNWALARVSAPRAAMYLTVQPAAGAPLGVLVLDEPLTAFTLAGAALIVLGLALSVERAAG